MNRDILRQILVIVATVATIGLNIMANALPLNGLNTGEISDRFDIYFVPAGYVFSIWFLIYLGLIAYTIFQALPSQRENPRLRSIGYIYILSSIANVTWLFLWHYEVFALTLFAMLTILISLILIYLRLDIGRSQVSNGERWAVHLPFSIYLGWITVATIANTTQLLFFINGDNWVLPPEIWAVIILAAGVVISAAMSWTRRDVAYSLVLVWAYIGIGIEHGATPLVSISAYIAAVLILIILAIALLRGSGSPQTTPVES